MMKFIKISILIIIVIAALVTGLYFFTSKSFENVENSKLYKTTFSQNEQLTMGKEYDTKEADLLTLLNRKIDYSTIQLTAIFPDKKGFKWHFNGPADYGKNLKIENIFHENGKTVLLIAGNLDDLSDGEAGNTDFQFSYILTNESIENSLNGVILKKPLVIGNEWEHPYMLDGKTYMAITRITELRGEFITTESVISDIPNYINSEYWRKDVYQLGKGLVYYAEVVEEDYGGCVLDYKEDRIIDIFYEFETRQE